ncbi:hypothetical protein M419DRAFT_96020 [Trichoderma reesei RUT C-30]|uniref:Nephrocystin 3-like N-terminal domain-containing protein n=1 Tax=Hypocrea jecorina (strain ATCC 56765 / BCRC 32924 / NRRL 11460 / Rut C-30) TaxID=1344414 RepID=A0A024SJA6_HYPJR|nr:hypothetical protein M419DRAFT_96020 [Trichoderma reesei RUT C-30]
MAELDPRIYTVAWIAPLEIEAQAALHMLDSRHSGRFRMERGDDYVFQAGDACGHNIIIATLPAGELYGTGSAAALASQVKKFFPNLWFGLLVGVAAGLPNLSRCPPLDIRLGDVLVGLPIGDNAGLIPYDLGKETANDGFQLLRAGHGLARTETVVRSAIGSIKLMAPHDADEILRHYKMIQHKEHSLGTFDDPGQERDVLYQVDERGIDSPVQREQRPVSKRTRIWYGSIGSGEKVFKNAQKRNELRDKFNLIGLEMEAAGTMDRIPVGVIRGVCDYGDEHKNKEWQPYAAATAAAYARAVLEKIGPITSELVHQAYPRQQLRQYESVSREPQPWNGGVHKGIDMDATIKQSLIEKLYFDKIDERLMNLTAAQGRTCRWFLDIPKYILWNDSSRQPEHGGFLWIKGNPGTGKSTLMKFLFEKAKANARTAASRIILSFFFLARGTIEEKSTTGLYRSLLHQLFEKVPETQNGLAWMTTNGAKVIQRNGWSEKALKQTLTHAVQTLGSRSLMILVDALDECNQEQVADMVRFFEELYDSAQDSKVLVQVCFSSRHYPMVVIEKGIEVTLENELGHTQDIQQYIRSGLRLGKSQQADSLRSEILEKSSGIFLWVVLVLEIINREYPGTSVSIKQIRDRLREIPPKLHDLFEMILTRDGENLDRLHLCLRWILFAARPLKPQELYFAVQFGLDEESSGFWDRRDVEIDEMKSFVSSLSKGLAEVTQDKGPQVQFIHESVRDFLQRKYDTQWSETPGGFVGHSHVLLRDCCMAQLDSLNFEALGISDVIPQASTITKARERATSEYPVTWAYPFLEYAISNVLHHADRAQQNGIHQENFLANFPLQRWISLNNTLETTSIQRYTNSVSLLYIYAEKNFAHLLRIHPQATSCFDIELEDERYGTPIFAALATGSREAVWAFLRKRAETMPSDSPFHNLWEEYCQDRSRRTRLSSSFVFSRRKGVLSYLVKEDEALFSSFLLANGIHPKAWLLLEHDVDPNVEHDGCYAFSYAAEGGHDPVIKLLLAKGGIDLNHQDNDGITPLVEAVLSGHTTTVQLLLSQEGIDVNRVDCFGRTPLARAVKRGELSIGKLLSDKGATF